MKFFNQDHVEEVDDIQVKNLQKRTDYGNRKRSHEIRMERFFLNREFKDERFREILLRTYKEKKIKIKRQMQTADHMAAYAPAGSGSGTPWFSIGPRDINGRVKFIAVHPTDEDIVYAGAASGGVWKTTNGGQSWDPLWNDQDVLSVGSLAIAPSNPDIIYAGTGEWTPGWGPTVPGVGVYVSIDAGNNWVLRNTLANNTRISRVLVSPTDQNTVYVAGPAGFERSTDAGATWTTLRTGAISDAVIDYYDADTMYINIRYDGIYKTTDGGATWDILSAGPTGSNADWIRLAIGKDGTNGTNFILAKRSGTINTSPDGGTTWNTLAGSPGSSSFHEWCNLVSVSPSNENIIIAGGVGIQRSPDGGTSWNTLAGLHSDHHVAAFALSNTNRVYSCNDGGVYRSDDAGATFKKMSHGLIVTQFNDIGSWQKISNVLGGGTQDQGTNMTTGGLTFSKVFGWDGGYFVVDHNDPRTMYAEHQNTEIFKSIDGGNSWTQKIGGITGSTPWVGVITMDPNNASKLYTGTQLVFRSTDGLNTDWQSSSQSIGGEITSIAVAKADSNRVYASSSNGTLIRSDDAGVTSPWAVKTGGSFPSRAIKDIVVDDTDEDRVFVCFSGTSGGTVDSIWMSPDGGDSWSNISGDLPDIGINAIALDSSDSNTFYVGTDVGVYRTANGGTNWLAFDNGIPNVLIMDLHVDPEEKVLYAATFGRGMYKLNVDPLASINTADIYIRDSKLDTGEIHPSPSGEPDPNDPSKNVYWWQSPDMKTDVTPFFMQDALFDGVEFDTELTDESPQRNNTTRFYAQVHNRGWQDANNIAVRAFIADASAGLPDLPADFWTAFPNSDPADTSIWTPVGPAASISVLKPHTPKIVSWDYVLPASTATHTCMLVVISSPDDPITTTELNIASLITSEKRAALRNLHVIDSSSPQPTNQISTINFHNAVKGSELIDILIDPVNFSSGNIGLLLQKGVDVDKDKLDGVTIYPLEKGEYIGDWNSSKGNNISLSELIEKFDTTRVFEFDPAKRSAINEIKVKYGESFKALVVSRPSLKADRKRAQTFDVLQRQEGKIVGGSTYQAKLLEPRNPVKASRLKVHLGKVKVLNDLDPWIKGRGEVVFYTHVSFNNENCRTVSKRFPEKGCFKINDKVANGEFTLNACLFDGYVTEADNMQVRICPVELDTFDPDDKFDIYNRNFAAPFTTWPGVYTPGDEAYDPEVTSNWLVELKVEEC